LSPGAVKKIHSWFESLTTNGFEVPSVNHLAVRPELRRRGDGYFFQLLLLRAGMFYVQPQFHSLPLFEKEGPGEICLSRGMTSDETF
jgi:hypothetical protein